MDPAVVEDCVLEAWPDVQLGRYLKRWAGFVEEKQPAARVFPVTPEGWVDLGVPSPETIARARRQQEEGPRQVPKTLDERARGFVAERGVHAWLRSVGAVFEVVGGMGDRPDLIVAGRNVDVKSAASPSQPRWRPSWCCDVLPSAHRPDEYLFVAVVAGSHYLIVGGCSDRQFEERSDLVEPGDRLNSGRRAASRSRRIRTDRLEPPERWLGALLPES